MNPSFEWNEDKASANIRKHQVGFDEAATVFLDPLARTMIDQEHSQSETRFVTIGMSALGRLLVVVNTERGRRIRIISCRRATGRERDYYEKG